MSSPTVTPGSSPQERGTASKQQDLARDGLLAQAVRDSQGRPMLKGIPILRKIGQGGMGAVYHGQHPRLGIEVAVKVLPFHLAEQDPNTIDYFMREARVAARLNHPNLVRVFDVDTDGIIHFLVMEYVSGLTAGAILRERMKTGAGPLPEKDVLEMLIAVTDGLASAHDEKMVHRDIKPENIIVPLDDKGQPLFRKAKLMDLGLAKDIGGAGVELTATNIAMGTPGYMSPEQAESARTATAAADIFSMGATLYALLSGTAPFAGTTVLHVLRRTVEEKHKPLREVAPGVSESIEQIVDRCLEKKPEHRYQNAGELRDALRGTRFEMATDPTMKAPTKSAAPSAPTGDPSTDPTIVRPSDRSVRPSTPGTARTMPQPVPAPAAPVVVFPQGTATMAPAPKRSAVALVLIVGLVGLVGLGGLFVAGKWVKNRKAAEQEERFALALAHAEDALRSGDLSAAGTALDLAERLKPETPDAKRRFREVSDRHRAAEDQARAVAPPPKKDPDPDPKPDPPVDPDREENEKQAKLQRLMQESTALVEQRKFEAARDRIRAAADEFKGHPLREKRFRQHLSWLEFMAEGHQAEVEGRWRGALTQYRKAQEMERGLPGVLEYMQKWLAASRDAVQRIERALRREEAEEKFAGAEAMFKSGRLDDAEKELLSARQTAPGEQDLEQKSDDLARRIAQAREAAIKKDPPPPPPPPPKVEPLELKAQTQQAGPVDELVVSEDGTTLFAVGEGFAIGSWKTSDLAVLHTAPPAPSGTKRPFSLTRFNSSRILAALVGHPDADGCEIHTFDPTQGFRAKELSTKYGKILIPHKAHRIAASSDGKALLAITRMSGGGTLSTDSYGLRVLDPASGVQIDAFEVVLQAQAHEHVCSSVASGAVASGGGTYRVYKQGKSEVELNEVDPNVHLWTQKTPTSLPYPKEHGAIACLQFTPDGGILAAGTARGRIILVEVARKRIRRNTDAGGAVLAVACTNDMAAVARAGGIRFITLDEAKLLHDAALEGVRSLAFLPGGRELIVGDSDGRLRKYAVNLKP